MVNVIHACMHFSAAGADTWLSSICYYGLNVDYGDASAHFGLVPTSVLLFIVCPLVGLSPSLRCLWCSSIAASVEGGPFGSALNWPFVRTRLSYDSFAV